MVAFQISRNRRRAAVTLIALPHDFYHQAAEAKPGLGSQTEQGLAQGFVAVVHVG